MENSKQKMFMLTGFSENEKEKLSSIIHQLGGEYLMNLNDSQGFDSRCTHLVAKKPCRSQKCMCACAKGCWILVAEYFYESAKVNKWLNETDYEWSEKKCVNIDQINFINAARRWRTKIENGIENFPFQGWVVGSALSKSFKIYQRFIEVGGGKVYPLKNQDSSHKFTHILADHRHKNEVEEYRKNGIPCIKSEFLARWILQETPPLARNYSIFDDAPVIKAFNQNQQTLDVVDQVTKTNEQHVVLSISKDISIEKNIFNPDAITSLPKSESSKMDDKHISCKDKFMPESSTNIIQNTNISELSHEVTIENDKPDLLMVNNSGFKIKENVVPVDSLLGDETLPIFKSLPKLIASDKKLKDDLIETSSSSKYGDVTSSLSEITCLEMDDTLPDQDNIKLNPIPVNKLPKKSIPATKMKTANSPNINTHTPAQISKPQQNVNTKILLQNFNTPLDKQSKSNSDILKADNLQNIAEIAAEMDVAETSKNQTENTTSINQYDSKMEYNKDTEFLPANFQKIPVEVYVADSPSSVDQSSNESECGDLSVLTDQTLSQNSTLEIENEPIFEPKNDVTIMTPRNGDNEHCDITVKSCHEVPDWLKAKRGLLESALTLLVQKNHSHKKCLTTMLRHSQQRDVSSGIRAQRFSATELRVLENYVKSGHWKSVLSFCRKYLSNSAYPTYDLLYLIMKQYILDCDYMDQSLEFISFLNSVFLMHHPSTSHIRHDDVYLQAMSVTYCTESSLLSVSEINARGAGILWSNPRQDSVEWLFFSRVVTTALTCNDTQRKSNAILLLTFLAKVIESNPRIIRALFIYSDQSVVTSSVKSLFSWLKKATEIVLQENSKDDDCDDVTRDEKDDVTMDIDSNFDDDNFENDENFVDPRDIEPALIKITNACIKLLGGLEGASLKRIPYLLSHQFVDANISTLQRLFSGMTSLDVITLTIKLLLESKCRTDLAKIKEKNCELSLHSLTQRYFYFIPKIPSIFTLNQTPTKSNKPMNVSNNNSPTEDKEKVYMLDNGVKVTSTTVNKKNLKGETLLHRSCIKNHPQVVAQVLKIPGVDPNLADNVGWTPLGEACNYGNVECVRELLRLPLGIANSASEQASNSVPLYIDLLACPDEGITPLHDAILCSHLDVAKLLVKKGGVELMYVKDKQGRTPLGLCSSDHANVLIGKQDQLNNDATLPKENATPTEIKNSIKDEDYEKLLPPCYLMSSDGWKKACDEYVFLLRHLIQYYVIVADLESWLKILCDNNSDDVTSGDFAEGSDVVTDLPAFRERIITFPMTSRYESDLFYILKWKHCDEQFLHHVRKLSGNPDYVIENKYLVFSEDKVENLNKIFR